MNLKTVGEFGLIDLIDIPHPAPERVVLGIGDDCAVLPYGEDAYQLASCDLLVEDIHFIRSRITPYQLGYKAVAVNLSDIAAMGGTPTHILISAALPPDYTVLEWHELYRGIGAICNRYGVNLIGGDTTSSPDKLILNVTVLGEVKKEHLHLRRDAKAGDAVFVTGKLGGSRAGLELVLQPEIEVADDLKTALLDCHNQPEPCCDEIAVLNRIAGQSLHALNDISDGLASECNEIAGASHCAIHLHAAQIPVHEDAKRLAELLCADSMEWALSGGEDYQLVGTLDGEKAEEICAMYLAQTGKQLYIVGTVAEGSGVELEQPEGNCVIGKKGYNHFLDKPELPKAEDEVQALLFAQIATLEDKLEAQRVYRHDLKNHLGCVLGYLECGNSKAAEQYLRQMLDTASCKEIAVHTGRAILDIICTQKAKAAEQKGIDFQYSSTLEGVPFAHISDYDLCALVANLLDNGIQHASGASPYLYLDFFTNQAGNTVLRMENSCNVLPIVHNGIFISCKSDQDAHGKGMKQIQQITESCSGTFFWNYDADEERFITQCVFDNQ